MWVLFLFGTTPTFTLTHITMLSALFISTRVIYPHARSVFEKSMKALSTYEVTVVIIGQASDTDISDDTGYMT